MLYIVGGYNTHYEATTTAYKIDTAVTLAVQDDTIAIESLMDTHLHRGEVQAVVSGTKAYILGGFTHEDGYCQPYRAVEVLDTSEEQDGWSYAPGRLNTGRANAAVVTSGGKFYVLGGETRMDDQRNCEGASSWEVNHNSPRRRTYPVQTVEVYNPRKGDEAEWSFVSGGLPDDRWLRFAAQPCPYNQEIYVFGGATNRDIPEDVTVDGRRIKASEGMSLTNSMGVYSDRGLSSTSGGISSLSSDFARDYRILGIVMLSVGSAFLFLAVLVVSVVNYRRKRSKDFPHNDSGAVNFARAAAKPQRSSGSIAFL